MDTQKNFTMYCSNTRQRPTNNIYKNAKKITCFDDLKAAAYYDNVTSLFSGYKRGNDNFLKADAFEMDVDNTHTENKAHHKNIDDVKAAFPDVCFYYIYSKNHNKEKIKDGQPYFPRFKAHIYFPLSQTIARDKYKALENIKISTGALFPYFDSKAADLPHYFDAVDHGQQEWGGYVSGNLCIDEYIRALAQAGMLTPSIKLALADAEKIAIQDHGANWREDTDKKPFPDLVQWENRSAAITGVTATGASKPKEHKAGLYQGTYIGDLNNQQIKQINYVRNFLDRNSIDYEEAKQGKYYYFYVKCPWNNLHTTPDKKEKAATIAIIPLEDGGASIKFNCWHAHCQDRTWTDYKAFYEPQTANNEPATDAEQEPDVIEEAPANLQSFLEKIQSEAYLPYKTSLKWLDNLFSGGMLKQSVCLLLAAPSAGKTTLCQQIAEAIAENKTPCIYVNLEMSREQMLAKDISRRLAKDGKHYTTTQILQGYAWTDQQRREITEAIADYEANVYPYLKYNPGNTGADLDKLLEYIDEQGKRAAADGQDGPVVVIDYLHLVTNNRGLDNQELLKQLIVGLKNYALKYNSIVIAISAASKESNKNGRVNLSSGRDSSNLEYTGDYVLGLNYKAVFDEKKVLNEKELGKEQEKEPREMILQILKARLGKQGAYKELYYSSRYNYFYSDGDFAPADNTPFSTSAPAKSKNRI